MSCTNVNLIVDIAWAALQLIFVFEVAIGSSIQSFFIRAIGTTLGCLWGWAAFEARNGNPFVCASLLFIGVIPCSYVQLASVHAKAGMVSIISMCAVALASELEATSGKPHFHDIWREAPLTFYLASGTENFLKRWLAFLIGGFVALMVEIILLPAKASTRMVESLANAIKRISEMEGHLAYGVEEGFNIAGGFPPEVLRAFELSSRKAKAALNTA